MTNSKGAPKKSADSVRSEMLRLRLTVGERKAYDQAAKKSRLSVSEWIRERLAEVIAKGGK